MPKKKNKQQWNHKREAGSFTRQTQASVHSDLREMAAEFGAIKERRSKRQASRENVRSVLGVLAEAGVIDSEAPGMKRLATKTKKRKDVGASFAALFNEHESSDSDDSVIDKQEHEALRTRVKKLEEAVNVASETDRVVTQQLTPSREKSDVTMTLEQFNELKSKAKETVNQKSGGKRCIFDAECESEPTSVASEHADDILQTITGLLGKANKANPLKLGVSVTSKTEKALKTIANECAGLYFSDLVHVTRMKGLIAKYEMNTQAAKAHTLLLAILRACASRRIEVTYDDLRVECK